MARAADRRRVYPLAYTSIRYSTRDVPGVPCVSRLPPVSFYRYPRYPRCLLTGYSRCLFTGSFIARSCAGCVTGTNRVLSRRSALLTSPASILPTCTSRSRWLSLISPRHLLSMPAIWHPRVHSRIGVAELLPGHPRPTSSLSLSPGWRLWLRWCRRLVFGLPEMTPRGVSYASVTPIIRPGVFGAAVSRYTCCASSRPLSPIHSVARTVAPVSPASCRALSVEHAHGLRLRQQRGRLP